MSRLDNLTRFAAVCLPSMSRRDEMLLLVVVSGRFDLPPTGVAYPGEPTIARTQPDVRLADEYGESGAQCLLHEGQSTYTRPGTDLYLHGHAWAPGGSPTAQGRIGLTVGGWQKVASVFGQRVWERGLGGVTPSAAEPFTSLPLTYARCFGGPAHEHNPIGRGYHERTKAAIGQPLPNFEDPRAPIRSPSERTPPCGFGPVARHWLPRRAHTGTYDQAWIDRRMPLWPADLDERFFSAAAPGLCATPHLQGGERVQIVGMSPAGSWQFALPSVRLEVRFDLGRSSVRRRMVLDAVVFEPDAAAFTAVWRAYLAVDPLTVVTTVVRTLGRWEWERR